ncbi:MAG TPA: DUF1674 domain-containing protein [Gammaproteobacteria bacterium]|nr:DUF1674 domain-containing protein [Gammaproteobacteria bacterium]
MSNKIDNAARERQLWLSAQDKDSPRNIAGESTEQPDSHQLKEIGGPAGLEPTRFGDWEKNGRCSDF